MASKSTEDGKNRINVRLEDHFSRDRSNDYDEIAVLSITWKQNDLRGMREEVQKIKTFFETNLRYPVLPYEIPDENSFLCLDARINQFLAQFSRPSSSLAIIHYGGHGDQDSDEGSYRAVWAAKRNKHDGPSLCWSDIQPKLGNMSGRVLLLFDCCFAAQAARGVNRLIPKNVELLAACAMNLTTPPPGDFSFTSKLLREFQTALEEKKPIIISEIQHALAESSRRLQQSPVYFSLAHPYSSIRLDPLGVPETVARSHAAEMSLRITMRDIPGSELLDEISQWLVINAPRNISSVVVTELTEVAGNLRDFALETASPSRSVTSIGKLPHGGQEEVRAAWTNFSMDLERGLKWVRENTRHESPAQLVEETPTDTFFARFARSVSTLQRVIERNILAIPEFCDTHSLLEATRDPFLRGIRVQEILQVKLATQGSLSPTAQASKSSVARYPSLQQPQSIDPLVYDDHPEFGSVLLEYKYYEGIKGDALDDCTGKVSRLASILQVANDSSYRTPKCLGWYHEDSESRFALVFQDQVHGSKGNISLENILRDPKLQRKLGKPSLGERFAIAHMIGEALLKWHTVGWVHQGIASRNIVFLRSMNGARVQYTEPYLCGFEFSRQYNELTRDKHMYSSNFEAFMHPDRQGHPPAISHTKEHDIYSFGLLLVEIAMWGSILDLFEPTIRKNGTGAIRLAAMEIKERIRHFMGRRYWGAVHRCLSGDLGVDKDDKMQSELARSFRAQSFDGNQPQPECGRG